MENTEANSELLGDSTPDLNILDLNDDCLIKVVSFLPFEDICALHQAHPRFKAAIATNLINREIPITSSNLKQMVGLLKIYKQNVKRIAVLSSAVLISELFYRMLDTMDRIEHLTLCLHGAINMPKLLRKLQLCQLKSLRLECWSECSEAVLAKWPRVESLQTLSIQSNLESINIVQCFPNIRELSLTNVNLLEKGSLNFLKMATNLKKLRLDLSIASSSELYRLLNHLADQNTLEHLVLKVWTVYDNDGKQLNYGHDFEILVVLSRFTRLKSLVLRTLWRFNNQLLTLVEPLTELRRLVISGDELRRMDLSGVEQLICRMQHSARSLHEIRFGFYFKKLASNEDYHRFYEKLCALRERQCIGATYNVQIAEKVRLRDDNLCIQTRKSVILNVVRYDFFKDYKDL